MLNKKMFVEPACRILLALCAGPYRRFQKDLSQPEMAQDKLLKKLLYDLAKTDDGRALGITKNDGYEIFAAKVPIQTYETLESRIRRQMETGRPILTPHRIIHVEPTSGSSGPVKHIPYTSPLLHSFSNMFRIWSYDQLRYGFKPETGRIFMSISPPIGDTAFTDDRGYLKEPLRSLVSPFLVLPPRHTDATSFQKNLALTLLKETGLEIISIWSPSYLLVLLDYIQENKLSLIPLLPLRQQSLLDNEPLPWAALWPKLKLISCWDNAMAEPLANRLRALFPHVQVQGKGLLATEAPITLPLLSVSGHLPLLNEVFLEFETAEGKIKRLHEVSPGEQLQVIVTQQGGLTRYRLNDLVEVRALYRNTPSFAFIGRSNQGCDLAGEKLTESFVCQALLPLIPSGCFLLLPYQAETSGYILLTGERQDALAEKAEKTLCEAYHYRLARNLRQIAPLKAIHVPDLLSLLPAFHQSEGMRLGNIKNSILIKDPEKGKRLLTFLSLCLQKPQPLPGVATAERNHPSPVHRQALPRRVGA
jgi:hypothetical protein